MTRLEQSALAAGVLYQGFFHQASRVGISALNSAANETLRDRALLSRLDALGARAMPGSVDDFAALVTSETRKYARVIEAAGIKARS